MKTLKPSFNKPLYTLYFITGILFSCVAIAIRITDRDGPGDLPQDFQVIGYTSIAGLVIGLVAYFVVKNHDFRNSILYSLWIFIRYFLALVFLNYGFIKILGFQFGNSLSSLDASLLNLSQNDMSVAWFFFGHSNAYEMFLGWGETVAALLLLFRRTAILGACILLTIVGNIVAINYWYDVSVKLNSTFYLLMTLWVLIYQYPRILHFFILDKAVEAPVYPTFSFSEKKLTAIRILNVAIVAAIIGFNAWDCFYRFPKEYGLDTTSSLRGVWKVEELNTALPDTLWTKELRKAKFYFDDYGYGVVKKDLTILSTFRYTEYGPDSVHISQIAYDTSYYFKGVFKKTDNVLELKGNWAGIPTTILMGDVPEYHQGNQEIIHKEVPVSTDELKHFVGKYKVASGYIISIILKENKLFRISDNAPDAELVSLGDHRFGYKGRPTYLQFHLSDQGEVVDATFTTYGYDYMVWKIAEN